VFLTLNSIFITLEKYSLKIHYDFIHADVDTDFIGQYLLSNCFSHVMFIILAPMMHTDRSITFEI